MSALDEFAERLDRALVGPRDNRVHIIETTHFPFNTVCHLGRQFGNGYGFGCTGFLVGPRLVMTAAHCIYSRRRRRAPLRIAVCPGRLDKHTFPFGCSVAHEFYVPRVFTDPGVPVVLRKFNDFGFIVLTRKFRGLKRFAPVVAMSNSALEKMKSDGLVGIAGYPGDRPKGTMWYHRERLKKFGGRRIYYTVDTCPGHSGSPIWTAPAGDRNVRIIGVHTSGILDDQGRSYGCSKHTVLAPPGLLNSGARVLPGMVSLIKFPTPDRFRSLGLVRVGGPGA